MAELDASQVRQVWLSDGPRRQALFEVAGVSGNDTVDLAALGQFARIMQVQVVAVSGTGGIGTPGLPGGGVVAFPSGLASDAVLMLVDGIRP